MLRCFIDLKTNLRLKTRKTGPWHCRWSDTYHRCSQWMKNMSLVSLSYFTSYVLSHEYGLADEWPAYYFTAQESLKHEFDLSVFNGAKTYIGIDLSLSNDLTTVAFLCKPDDNYYLHTISFTTQKTSKIAMKSKKGFIWSLKLSCLIILESDYIRASDIIAYMKSLRLKQNVDLQDWLWSVKIWEFKSLDWIVLLWQRQWKSSANPSRFLNEWLHSNFQKVRLRTVAYYTIKHLWSGHWWMQL